jgi:hypothetical protein
MRVMATGEREAANVAGALAATLGPGVYEVTMVAFVREDRSFLYSYGWRLTQQDAPAERPSVHSTVDDSNEED